MLNHIDIQEGCVLYTDIVWENERKEALNIYIYILWSKCAETCILLLKQVLVIIYYGCITVMYYRESLWRRGSELDYGSEDHKDQKVPSSIPPRGAASTLCLLLICLVPLQALAPWCMSACLDLVLLKPDLCTMEERVRLTCAQLFLTIIKALVLVLTLTSPRLSMLRSSSNVTDELLLLLLL